MSTSLQSQQDNTATAESAVAVTCHYPGDIYLGLRLFGPLLRRDIRRQRVDPARTTPGSLFNVLATTHLHLRISHNYEDSLSRTQEHVKIHGAFLSCPGSILHPHPVVCRYWTTSNKRGLPRSLLADPILHDLTVPLACMDGTNPFK